MLNYTAELELMLGRGYRFHAHGEWIDTHFGNWQVGVFGASLAATSMSSNQRFVIVEL
jgi:hypothetical protein